LRELATPDLDLIKQVEQECGTATSSDFAVVAIDGTAVGGCSFMIHVRHAAAAIASGLCETVLITHGESGRSGAPAMSWRRRASRGQFEQPYGPMGPPTLFTIRSCAA
jgi:acetyl-CoA acetyltransferase